MTANYDNLFVLDVEATDKTPMTGLMTEFGIVHVTSGRSFYAHLYDFHPHPNTPALPVVDRDLDGKPITNPYIGLGGSGSLKITNTEDLAEMADLVRQWVIITCALGSQPVMVSDNNGFDAMWFSCFLDKHGVVNPFGFSSRRIGDYYAGTRGKWSDASSWKRLRRTKHTHNPVDDARGNAEALCSILGIPAPGDKWREASRELKTPGKKLRTFTLWVEGYAATMEHGTAMRLGDYEAETFDEAVQKWNSERNAKKTYGELEQRDDGTWTVWGCRIFDNEAAARKSFG